MPRPAALIVATLCMAACNARPSLPDGRGMREFRVAAALHGTSLTLHVAGATTVPRTRPLVIYASGDGGWFGAATAMFRTIADGGFPVVGFSSRAFMKIEQSDRTPFTEARIGESYRVILAAARRALSLPPDQPVVLSGWSRGASLSVLAAAASDDDPAVTGVVAIGLPRDERLDLVSESDGDPLPESPEPSPKGRDAARTLLMYSMVERLAARRCAVIQATGDRYLPATEAHSLFGRDSDRRRFFEIPATNHRFSGGKPALQRALLEAITWAAEKSS